MNKFMKKLMKKDGFTLVELIVVIAILAILAGVAVPAYSGYIKKANEAGDTQIVSAVNTALAAAATENSVALTDLGTYLKIDDSDTTSNVGGKVTISVQSLTDSDKAALATELLKDFKFYYGDSSGEFTFKYYVNATIGADGNLSCTDPS